LPDRQALARRARAARQRDDGGDDPTRSPDPAGVPPSAGSGNRALPGEPGYRPRGTPQYFEGDIARPSWDEWLPTFTWRGCDGSRDAQHVTLIAATRDGKSHLANVLEKESGNPKVVVFAAKPPGDPALEQLKKDGYKHITSWPWSKKWGVRTGPKLKEGEPVKLLFWPNVPANAWEDRTRAARLRGLFAAAMDDIFEGPWVEQTGSGWTERWDEGIYSTQSKFLAQRDRLEDHWQRIAGTDSCLMFLCQRGSTVPLLAYDQIGHLFAGRCNDRRDAERVGEMMGQDRMLVRDALAQLQRFEFLHFDKEAMTLAIIQAPPPKKRSAAPARRSR
jgi:hypothetical protein